MAFFEKKNKSEDDWSPKETKPSKEHHASIRLKKDTTRPVKKPLL